MSKKNVYVCIPMKPTLCPELADKAMLLARRMIPESPDLNLTIVVDAVPIPGLPSDDMPWSRVARARHSLLNLLNLTNHEWLIWIDADVIDYPADLAQWLIHGAMTYADNGICAPTVLIEGTETFYDTSAFIYKGKEHVEPFNRNYITGRNINGNPPYYDPDEALMTHVEMACVGTVYAVHRDIYTSSPVMHSEHHAFTDHYPICERAWQMGRKVVALPNVVVHHANLGSGKYPGESFH